MENLNIYWIACLFYKYLAFINNSKSFTCPKYFRYYDSVVYGIYSHINKKKGNLLNQQKYLRLMLDEETNAALLRLLSCFLMSAPQAIIQLVFLLSQYIKSSNNSHLMVGNKLLGKV